MTAPSMTCKQCKSGMSLQPLDPACGEQGVLKVTLIQLPALVCPNMHRRFAMPEFPILVLERVAGKEMETLPAGKKSGLLFKNYHCGTCGAALDKGAGREETFDFDVTLEGFSPFRVELTLPLHKCASCGKEQLRALDEVQKLAPPAMARAFKAAGLHPE
jgi:hypothetical protein